MNDTEIKYNHKKICTLVAERKLKPAFDLIEKTITENGLGEFSDDLMNLEQNYRFMLQYTVEGIKDPERQKIYRHLQISTYELVDLCYDNLKMKHSSSVEYQKKRGFNRLFIEQIGDYFHQIESFHLENELRAMVNDTIEEKTLLLENNHYQKNINLFYHYWFRNKLTEEEIIAFLFFQRNDHIPVNEKSFMISSLILSLIRFFDDDKLSLLFDCYNLRDEEINQRALIGILLCLYHYDKRVSLYPSIKARLEILNDDSSFRKHLEKILLQLIGSKETEKIQRKFEDEILPEVMKLSPNLRNKLSIESMFSDSSEDKNPDWQDIFKDSPGLMDKMEELTEMQLKGADVFMTSFSSLKSFPFFGEIANWFVPFYPGHPALLGQNQPNQPSVNNKFLELIQQTQLLCNSDKYSFCFSMRTVPEEYKRMMLESMSENFDQMLEIDKSDQLISSSKKAEIISGQYIRDLYRFFKLYPLRQGFEDIFSWSFDFHNKETFHFLLHEDLKMLRNIAEFYFAKNYFVEAAELYQILLKENNEAEILQKTAFCFQKQSQYETALNYYLKADLFDQNKLWNLKKIALCYRNRKKPDLALSYYQQAAVLEPDNLANHSSIGHCQMELGLYEDALKSFFKVEYLAPGNKKIWRPIGWCSLLVGKKKQSENYFQKLVSNDPNKFDLMNMGHVQWCLGKRKSALNYYKQSINDKDNSEEEFMAAFNEDIANLIQQGVEIEDVPIMLDQLRYSLEKE